VYAPYIPILISSEPIVAKSIKLSSRWHVEIEPKIYALHDSHR
jgi:hypothetical protein